MTTDSWLLLSMYSDKILDHFHYPRNVGEIENATALVEATNPVCGDVMKLWVVVREGKIAEVKFKIAGCVPAVACGAWLTEQLAGKLLPDLSPLPPEEIETALDGVPQASHHAAVLASDVLKRLLEKVR